MEDDNAVDGVFYLIFLVILRRSMNSIGIHLFRMMLAVGMEPYILSDPGKAF